MSDFLKSPFTKNWSVENDRVIVKGKEILFSEFDNFKYSKLFRRGKIKSNEVTYYLKYTSIEKYKGIPAMEFIDGKFKEAVLVKNSKAFVNPMVTGKGMYEFALKNGFCKGFKLFTGYYIKKHFNVLAKNLVEDEIPIMTFMGIHDKKLNKGFGKGQYAYALTNKRFIYGQKGLFSETFEYLKIEHIDYISFKKGWLYREFDIVTYRQFVCFCVLHNRDQLLNKMLQEEFHNLKEKQNNSNNSSIESLSNADEIRKYKRLLDDGIITQEEFDTKKKELLGL